MIDNKTKKILDLAKEASLNIEENQIFINFIMKLNENDNDETKSTRDEIYKLLTEKPHMVKKVVENFRRKQDIIAKQDKQAWQELLKEEEKELEALAKEE